MHHLTNMARFGDDWDVYEMNMSKCTSTMHQLADMRQVPCMRGFWDEWEGHGISKCISTMHLLVTKRGLGINIIKCSYSLNQHMINARWKKMFDLKVEIKGHRTSRLGVQAGMGCPRPKGQHMHSIPAHSPVQGWYPSHPRDSIFSSH